MAEKIYCNAISIKEGKFGFKVSFKVDDFKQFLDAHANEKGYVNVEIKKRKEVSQYGHTHYAELDTWQPNHSGASEQQQQSVPEALPPMPDGDGLPF